ncbi:MAG: formate/nitrite transporter family protein [Spirochaetaceae bacterium]|nr:formate/nitrite transporter family protein [Spirochaetaceae bacterium]
MYTEEFAALADAAKKKWLLLASNPSGYFIASMLAGIFVGFGVILAYTLGGQTAIAPYSKLIMGIAFAVALSLVMMDGAELFTGSNLVCFAGVMKKTINIGQLAKIWLVCYIGNWLGSIILAIIFILTGLSVGTVGEFIAATAANKMSAAPMALLFRAILCNVLVCLAVWSSYRLKSESAKLIMIFWCIFAFFSSGFEHSIANMTLFTIALLAPFEAAVSFSGYLYNLSIVTLGNIIGSVCIVGLPYYLISRQKRSA